MSIGERRGNSSQPTGFVESSARICPACDTERHREQAHYCVTCGRKLDDTSYLPVRALLASYRMQENHSMSFRQDTPVAEAARSFPRKIATTNRNDASATALAFATYALVPYLGILFCPGAIVMGGVGLIRSVRVPQLGGRRSSYAGIAFGVMIFSAQIFLWWILYKVPQWATGVEF